MEIYKIDAADRAVLSNDKDFCFWLHSRTFALEQKTTHKEEIAALIVDAQMCN